MSCERFGGLDKFREVAAQERIGLFFQAKEGRYGIAVAGTQPAHLLQALAGGGVVRLGDDGKGQIGLGVFVGAVDHGLIGQGAQLLQGGVHLLRRALEQAAAAGGKQGVTAKQRVMADIADVAAGMPGSVEHLEAETAWIQGDGITLANGMGEGGDALMGRAVDRDLIALHQFLHTARVIPMVVGDQDGDRLQVVLFQPRDHRIGIARVDNGHVVVVPATDEPDIIVVEGVDASNFQHGHKPVRLSEHWAPLYTMKRLLQAYRCHDAVEARRQLRRWYRTALGQNLQQTEQDLLNQVLPNLFGYHLLQLGRPMEEDLLCTSRIPHRMVMEDAPPLLRRGREEAFLGRSDQLPIATDSLDVILLPHTLEYVGRPHEVLREAERTLIPEGHLVILGFNPWSLFGLRRLFSGWRDLSPWCGHFYSTLRLKDWLALLGFDTVLVRPYFFRPPLQNDGIMRRLSVLERAGGRFWPLLGGGYLLVAKKRVATLTPIKPRWRSSRNLVTVGTAEPTVRRDKT